jgi:predicted regulator of Ras-like GTPase activity (Roadblock/LC7/MglB family)
MGVTGTLQDMSLTGLISLNCNEGNQAKLRLKHDDKEALMYFDQGQIMHIEMDDQEGEEVMRELLMWEDGEFELDMDVPPPKRTIHVPWSQLVLDCMREIDECAAELDEEEDIKEEPIKPKEEVNEMADMKDLLQEMASEIPGFIAADVVGVDGLSIANYSANPNFNTEMASAQFALVMKMVQKTTGRLKAGEVEDNLVTTDNAYILTRFLGDNTYYLSIAVDKTAASLGNVRLMAREYAEPLWNAIPRRGR